MNLSMEKMRGLEFFRELPGDVFQTLFHLGKCVRYRKKESIFRAGERVEYVYITLEGEVMLYNLTKHGSRKIIFILGEGHLVNHNISNTRTVSVFCEAVGAATLLQIPLDAFRKLMEQKFMLTSAVLGEYERYIWRLGHQLKNTTGSLLMERKIAAKLWKLGRDFGIETEQGSLLELDLTMTVFADLVGAPRENVSRACRNLSEQGLLIYKNRRFLLPDPDGLAAFYKQ